MSPLNPRLFAVLTRHFGIVEIVNSGKKRVVKRLPNGSHEVLQRGEEYRLCCPRCGDRRKRLYVSYMQGQYDPVFNRVHRYLFYCHNCDLHKQPVARDHFADQIALPSGTRLSVAQSIVTTEDTFIRPNFELPEGLIPIDAKDAQAAAAYLESRNFNISELSRIWNVQYCPAYSLLGTAALRIVAPICQPASWFRPTGKRSEVQLAGWQARYAGEPPKDVPKYIFPPGMQKSRLLYGLPQAMMARSPVVICEGVTDVWRVGPGAVAIFGKVLSERQRSLICHHFNGRPVVVLLDADAGNEARQIVEQLASSRGDHTALAVLPPGIADPGDAPLDVILQAVAAALQVVRR